MSLLSFLDTCIGISPNLLDPFLSEESLAPFFKIHTGCERNLTGPICSRVLIIVATDSRTGAGKDICLFEFKLPNLVAPDKFFFRLGLEFCFFSSSNGSIVWVFLTFIDPGVPIETVF